MSKFKDLFSDPSSRFEIKTALKICFPPLMAFVFVMYTIFLLMDIIYAFFRANGYLKSEALREAFYEYIIGGTLNYGLYVLGYFILLFISGYYLSILTLRPFKSIQNFCEAAVTEDPKHFKTEIMATLNVLVSLSMKFFQYMDTVHQGSTKFEPQYIPRKYVQIKGPRFNLVFFIHYTFLLLVIAGVSYFGLYMMTIEIYDKISELAIKTLATPTSELREFLEFQKETLKSILHTSIFIICLTYAILGFGFTKKVNGVIFRYLESMKLILRGDREVRIVLRRDDPGKKAAEAFNKYICHVLSKR